MDFILLVLIVNNIFDELTKLTISSIKYVINFICATSPNFTQKLHTKPHSHYCISKDISFKIPNVLHVKTLICFGLGSRGLGVTLDQMEWAQFCFLPLKDISHQICIFLCNLNFVCFRLWF